MPADQKAKPPPSRVPLADAKEMPVLEAVYWLAFGVFPDPTTLTYNEREVFDARESAFDDWCRSQPGGLSSRQYVVGQPARRKMAVAVRDVNDLWPLRKQMDKGGRRFLRLTIEAARLHRSFARKFEGAQADFLEAARSGLLAVRAKVSAEDAVPGPLDPAYFRNPVEIELPYGHLVRARRSHRDPSAGGRPIAADLTRFDPLVSVEDVASVFEKPVNRTSGGPILKAAREYMSSQAGGRVIKDDLKAHLESAGLEISDRQFKRISKEVGKEFPNAFKAGRPPKK